MPLIQANGTQLFYDFTGPESAPVVVFSNSLGTTLEMWDAQVRALAPRWRCLRYDLRGHGRSPVVDGPLSIEDLAADLVALLDALGIGTVHLVGLSLGGMTAQAVAAHHPRRLDSLVLMATAAHLPPASAWNERVAKVRDGGMAAIVDGVMARWFVEDTIALAPEHVRPVRERFVALDPRGYIAACLAVRDMDLRGVIGRIRAPTLIVAGEEDPATPLEMAQEIETLIPGAELTVIPEAAHLLAVEQPDVVNEILTGFLERIGGEPPAATGGVSFEAGLANRKSVLGVEHVQRSLANAGSFAAPWQDYITRNAWGEIWGDPTLPFKTRSIVTLAMMVALHREEEFKLHVRPALKNGVTVDELRSLLIQCAVYAGVPASNAAFRWVREILGEEADQASSLTR